MVMLCGQQAAVDTFGEDIPVHNRQLTYTVLQGISLSPASLSFRWAGPEI